MCGVWNAAMAFSFLTGVLWFASFLLSVLAWKGGERRSAHGAEGGAPAAVVG